MYYSGFKNFNMTLNHTVDRFFIFNIDYIGIKYALSLILNINSPRH